MTTLYMDGVTLATEVRSLLPAIQRKDQELGRRLKRAVDDVPSHLAESMCLKGRKKRLELEAARRSAKEVLACMQAARGVGHLQTLDRAIEERIEKLLERITAPPEALEQAS